MGLEAGRLENDKRADIEACDRGTREAGHSCLPPGLILWLTF